MFSTVKGYTGHQESAAGAVLLMEASQLVQRRAVPPALHLRNLNPHVHGTLAHHDVSIARGGPLPASCKQSDGRLLIGVSSFGAQGTNAHALVGSSLADTTMPTNDDIPWKSMRYWVAPPLQSLIDVAWVLKRSKARGAGVTIFQVDLAAPRFRDLWQYHLSKRQYLPSAAIVAIASSAPAMLAVEDSSQPDQLSTLLGATLPAPLMLPLLRRGPATDSGSTIAVLTVRPSVESAEVVFSNQKVLNCKLGSVRVHAAAVVGEEEGEAQQPISGVLSSTVSRYVQLEPQDAVFSKTADPLDASSVAGYPLHPAQLDAAISQAALYLPALSSPPTWLRSISAVVLPQGQQQSLCAGHSYAGTSSRVDENWSVASAWLTASAPSPIQIVELVVGEHDLPPTSPGPSNVSPGSARTANGAQEVEEDAAEDGLLPADHPLLDMPEEERMLHLQAQVMTEVRNVVGHAIHPEEPLMTAGLDSRGGMELRRTMATALGMQLPVTLLYDYQTIDDIVEYINSTVVESAAKAAAESSERKEEDGTDDDDDDGVAVSSKRAAAGQLGAASQQQPQVSKLLKTLRPAPVDRPLFLAAPGVANAQSAYFSFSSFLQWSTQPIYVLDKDNDLNLTALALQNASDIVAICPEGPYLVGGHSYGGAVAVEIAMVLESWGKEVGLVLVRYTSYSIFIILHDVSSFINIFFFLSFFQIMDTPLTEQIRPGQPDSTAANDEDCLELMEMILGALGRDALGLGSSIAHPKESDEWKRMTVRKILFIVDENSFSPKLINQS